MSHPKISLNKAEYEAIYRILITSSVESLAEQRNLEDVLEALEARGMAIGADEGNGVPRMYTIVDEVELEVSRMDADTLRTHLDSGVGRFQVWAVRPIAGVLERLELKHQSPN